MSSGSGMSSPAAERRSRATCSAQLGRAAGADAERLEDRRHRAGSRDRTPTGGGRRPAGGGRRPRRAAGAAACAASRSVTRPPRPPIAPSGPRALATVSSHSAAGSLFHVIPPPTWSVSRRPSATKVRMRMLVCIAPSGPIQPIAPGVRPAPDRLEPLEDLHRPDLRRAGDRAAGKRRGEQVERVAAVGQHAGHRRDEVLDGGRPLEPAQPRHADAARAGRRARGRCAGRRRSSRSRRGPWRSTSSSQASARSSARVAAARAGALDRVVVDDAVPRRPRGTARATPTGAPAAGRLSGPGPRSRYAENSDGSPVRRRR